MRFFRLQNEEGVPPKEAEAEKPEMPETPKAEEVKKAVTVAVEKEGEKASPEKVAEAAVTAVAEVIAEPVIDAVEAAGEEAAPEEIAVAVTEVVAETAADGSQQAQLQVDGLNAGELVTILNKLFASPPAGLHLPPDTNETNLMDRLRLLAGMVDGGDDNGSLEEFEVPAGVPEEVAARLRIKFAEQQRQLALAESKVASTEKQTKDRARQLFVMACDGFVRNGQMTPAAKRKMLGAGQLHGYALSLLSGFDDIPANTVLPTKSISKQAIGVSGRPSDFGNGGSEKLTPEQIKERSQELYGR